MVHQINIKMPKKRTPFHTKYYLSDSERKALLLACGDAALLLLEYYIRIGSIGDEPMTDPLAAEYFAWHERKVRRLRQALQREGWFGYEKYNMSKGRKGITYYIGKSAVEEHLVK